MNDNLIDFLIHPTDSTLHDQRFCLLIPRCLSWCWLCIEIKISRPPKKLINFYNFFFEYLEKIYHQLKKRNLNIWRKKLYQLLNYDSKYLPNDVSILLVFI